jgi:hypothetical protein
MIANPTALRIVASWMVRVSRARLRSYGAARLRGTAATKMSFVDAVRILDTPFGWTI